MRRLSSSWHTLLNSSPRTERAQRKYTFSQTRQWRQRHCSAPAPTAECLSVRFRRLQRPQLLPPAEGWSENWRQRRSLALRHSHSVDNWRTAVVLFTDQTRFAGQACCASAAPVSASLLRSIVRRMTAAYRLAAPPAFGRFAPYFERPWRRLSTPWLSSVPRTI